MNKNHFQFIIQNLKEADLDFPLTLLITIEISSRKRFCFGMIDTCLPAAVFDIFN
jgi:hypothetical protein